MSASRIDRCACLIQGICADVRVGAGGERVRLRQFIPLTILYPRLGHALVFCNYNVSHESQSAVVRRRPSPAPTGKYWSKSVMRGKNPVQAPEYCTCKSCIRQREESSDCERIELQTCGGENVITRSMPQCISVRQGYALLPMEIGDPPERAFEQGLSLCKSPSAGLIAPPLHHLRARQASPSAINSIQYSK